MENPYANISSFIRSKTKRNKDYAPVATDEYVMPDAPTGPILPSAPTHEPTVEDDIKWGVRQPAEYAGGRKRRTNKRKNRRNKRRTSRN